MGSDRFTVDEKQLLEKLASGNPEAFTILYRRYGRKLHAHLIRMIRSEEIAREIFQDVFMKIWEYREKIDVNKPFAAFLYHIAENKVYDYFRRVAREKRLAENLVVSYADFYTDDDDEALYQERFGLINSAIDLLPPVRKQIYLFSRLEGKSYEEIAQLLGISTSTVNDHIVKANRFLKKVLAGHTGVVVLWIILFRV